MKKILLGTTALAAAGMLAYPTSDATAQEMKKAQPVKISVGGYFTSMIGFADQDGSYETAVGRNYRPASILNDSEIYFTGNTTLDNGLRIDVIIQLETDQATAKAGSGGTNANSSAPIDESYIKLTGGFGDIRVGSTKAAAFVLGVPTLPAGIIRHDTLDVGKFVVAPSTTGISGVDNPASPFFLNGVTSDVGPSDALKIVYISPVFAGFRGGVSYWPAGPGGDNIGNQPSIQNSAADYTIQYKGKFGDVGLDVAGHYVWNSNGSSSLGSAANSVTTWNGGVALTYAGFRLSGRYGRADEQTGPSQSPTQRVVDDFQYDAEIRYASGPWAVSFTYQHGESEETIQNPANLERTVYFFGAQYALGPGVTLGANVFRVDWQDEVTAAANNNDGWAVVGGLKVNF